MSVNKIIATGVFIASICSTSPLAADVKAAQDLDMASIESMNNACQNAAKKEGYTVAVAIFNDNGNLLSFSYGGASPAASEVAQWKGLSAALYRVSTAETAKWNVPTAPKISTAQGGVPLFNKNGDAVGGIGVSGAPPQFDEDCGVLAAKAVGLNSI